MRAILSIWIVSYLGHAVLSVFYEHSPAMFVVPVIYAAFTLLTIGAWRRNFVAATMCAIAAVMTLLIQGAFIWKRDAYGSLSLAALVFDVLGIVSGLLYLVFFFSAKRELYFAKPKVG